VAPFEPGEIGPDLFRAACKWGSKGWCRSGLIAPIAPRKHPAYRRVQDQFY
jgi:hypothetical protein